MELGAWTWGVFSMQHILISCVQRDCLRCWILGIVLGVEYWTHPVPINPECINQWDHSSLRLDDQIIPWSARVNTCCKLTGICQLSTATAPNDQKHWSNAFHSLRLYEQIPKRDFGGDPVGQGGQWWKKWLLSFLNFDVWRGGCLSGQPNCSRRFPSIQFLF